MSPIDVKSSKKVASIDVKTSVPFFFSKESQKTDILLTTNDRLVSLEKDRDTYLKERAIILFVGYLDLINDKFCLNENVYWEDLCKELSEEKERVKLIFTAKK